GFAAAARWGEPDYRSVLTRGAKVERPVRVQAPASRALERERGAMGGRDRKLQVWRRVEEEGVEAVGQGFGGRCKELSVAVVAADDRATSERARVTDRQRAGPDGGAAAVAIGVVDRRRAGSCQIESSGAGDRIGERQRVAAIDHQLPVVDDGAAGGDRA